MGCVRESGQATPLLALVVLLTAGASLALATMGVRAVDRARASAAADAAALAGAAEGPSAAAELATANGGRLDRWSEDHDAVQVAVSVEGVVGEARARWRAGDDVQPDRSGLAPGMLAALDRAEELLGEPVTVVSGFRTRAEQAALYARRGTNRYPVARPGTSAHERGLAVDVPLDLAQRLREVAESAGLCMTAPAADPIHFELCRWTGAR